MSLLADPSGSSIGSGSAQGNALCLSSRLSEAAAAMTAVVPDSSLLTPLACHKPILVSLPSTTGSLPALCKSTQQAQSLSHKAQCSLRTVSMRRLFALYLHCLCLFGCLSCSRSFVTPSSLGVSSRKCVSTLHATTSSPRYFHYEHLIPPLLPIDEETGSLLSATRSHAQTVSNAQIPLQVTYTNDPGALEQWLKDHVPREGGILGFDVEVGAKCCEAVMERMIVLHDDCQSWMLYSTHQQCIKPS
jgi:hypothetical protein